MEKTENPLEDDPNTQLDDLTLRTFVGADWAKRVSAALLVWLFGHLIVVFVPLLAVACLSCQDGVRDIRLSGTFDVLSFYLVPATTYATMIGAFLPRRGLRVGCIGAGILVVLAVLILIVGHVPA